MDDPSSQALLGISASILAGAFINGMTAALDALGPVRLQAIAEGDLPISKVAARALERADAIRDRWLVARVACIASAAALAATSIPWLHGFGGDVLAVVIVAFLYALAAQLAASVARRRPSVVALHLLRLMRPFEYAMAPFTWPLALVRKAVEGILDEPKEPVATERMVEIAMEQALEQSEAAGVMDEEQTALLWNVLEFHHTIAREIMIPRMQVVGFEIDTPVRAVLDTLIESQHSRYPVFRGTLDHVEGVLFAKDLFRAMRDRGDIDSVRLADILRKPVFFVPQSQKIGEVLRKMQSRRIHLAVVTDEFGGTSGIVTLEDIVEEIVGEIQDEHDEEEPLVREVEPGVFVARAHVLVFDLSEQLGEELPHDSGDFDSLGGLVVHLAGRVPEVGDVVQSGPFDLRVLEADRRSVQKVEIVRRAETPTETGTTGD
ncbi:MAG: hemolysin family protein [Polyangiales bacterium]